MYQAVLVVQVHTEGVLRWTDDLSIIPANSEGLKKVTHFIRQSRCFDHSLNQTPIGLVSLRVRFHFAHILRQYIDKKSDNNTNAVEEIALPKSFTLN